MPPLVEIWPGVALAVLLIAAAIADLRTGKIYNTITYPGVVVGLIGHTLAAGLIGGGDEGSFGLAGSLMGLGVGFLPLLIAWRLGGIGGGDAKLMAAVGAIGGAEFAVYAMFYSCAVAIVMALGTMAYHRVLRRSLRRIFVFLYTVLARARPVDPAGPDSPTVAFGVALCIGSGIAVVEMWFRGGMW